MSETVARAWTLKGVSEPVRSAAITAAEKADMAIGKWVERAIIETIKRDRQDSRAVVPHKPTQRELALVPTTQVTEAIDLLKQLSEVAGKPPAAVSKAAWAMIQAKMETGHQDGSE